ncbi:hypothetical protein CDEST_15407 [Colletotrichum destructivum]|uniref:Uncharacterized protein n=1 Tax=Colletotrichum destructivum TaxID=34406 RepID=A0AAX4J4U4_9PEZI|nr:hypothetical protein CDEST_15407 [Colletotrichum destructivum]
MISFPSADARKVQFHVILNSFKNPVATRCAHTIRFSMKTGLTTLLLTLSGLCNAASMCEFKHTSGSEMFGIGTSDGFVNHPAGCSYSFVCEAAGCSFSNTHPAGCVSSCHLQ